MQLRSNLMRPGGQVLWKKAEPNHQQSLPERKLFYYQATDFTISNRGTLISLAAFVDPILLKNQEK